MFELFKHKSLIPLRTRDIHNHLLPGVDDGFRNPEDSIQAIRTMVEHGVSEIVFTPHMNPDVYPNESESHFRAVFASFEPKVRAFDFGPGASSRSNGRSGFRLERSETLDSRPSTLDLQLHLAAEYMVVKDFEHRVADHADELLTYPDGSILIEMSYLYRSRNFEDAIFELGMAGLKPIVAHPERYLYMVDSLHDYERWIDMGASLQLNYLSLTGQYGEASVKIMRHLLEHNMYSHVATDLHSLSQLNRLLTTKVDSKLLKLVPTV